MPDPTPYDERLRNLDHLRSLVEDRSASDYDFKRATGSLAQDLNFVSDALRRDADLWRLNRAFHAVHVPSFLAILSMLNDIDDMKSVSEDERHQIYGSINRAAQLASSAREKIEQAALAEARIELDVLASYAPASKEDFEKASFFERTRDGFLSVSSTTMDRAKNSVESMPGIARALKDSAAGSLERISAVPLLASNLQRTLTGVFSDNVTKPIGMRLHASGKALTQGASAGVGLGAMAAVLFPPLVPVSIGAALLVTMQSWRKEMRKAQALNGEARNARIAALQSERAAALRRLTNGEPSVQMETDELSLTLDAETGQADALILKGKHAGRTWSDLSEGERTETIFLLSLGADTLLQILEFASEVH